MDNREFKMTDANFKAIRETVYKSAGIVLGDHKREMVYSRLARRLRALNIDDFASYLAYLDGHQEQEFSHFINAITTNLTAFFRENHHFEYLSNDIVPNLRRWHANDKRIRVWSAGCSTGEEPYSIAMTLGPIFNQPGWDFKILATDLDSNVLTKGKSGIYTANNVEGMDKDKQKKWFVRSTTSDNFKVKPELQKMISFKRLNLLQKWPMSGPFDVIFCRNVVIYFDQETKNTLFHRYAGMLRPGGYLFLGHSESMHRQNNEFEALGQTIYRKIN